MHPDRAFTWDDRAAALAFIADFAHVFAATTAGPRVAHVPVLVARETLRFHLSNGNALTPHLDGAAMLASVNGPRAYISPNWYANGEGQVPTWNYLSVEVEGVARQIDGNELIDLLDASTTIHETRASENWTRAKMDPRRFEAMCRAITIFELPATVIRATAKLSQNKSDADALGVAAELRGVGQDQTAALIERDRQ